MPGCFPNGHWGLTDLCRNGTGKIRYVLEYHFFHAGYDEFVSGAQEIEERGVIAMEGGIKWLSASPSFLHGGHFHAAGVAAEDRTVDVK
jgi:hypothetical protein